MTEGKGNEKEGFSWGAAWKDTRRRSPGGEHAGKVDKGPCASSPSRYQARPPLESPLARQMIEVRPSPGKGRGLFYCPHCGKVVERDSDKQWVKSYCTTTERNVRLQRLQEKEQQ